MTEPPEDECTEAMSCARTAASRTDGMDRVGYVCVGSPSARSWLGFGLLLLVFLPVKVLQASWESSLWIDEIYSLQLSFHPFARLIDLTSVDAHPPLYYLVIKYWRELGTWMGLDPGILWVRSINVIFWIGLVAAAWFGCRRAMGRSAGTLAAWAIAVSAQLANEIGNLRSYALAVPAVFICFIALAILSEDIGPRQLKRRATWGLWVLYSVCGAVALWSHLLSVFILLFLGLGWAGIVVWGRAFRSSYAIGGLAAHLAIVLLFLPWGIEIPRQYAYFMNNSGWVPDPTLHSWVNVFVYWYSVGDVRGMPGLLSGLLSLLAVACVALPLIAVIAAVVRKNRWRENRAALWTGLCGLGLALGYVSLTWLIHRLGIARVFFGPRYSVFSAAMWAVGLVGIASWSVGRLGWRPVAAWGLLAPWFLAAAAGQIRLGLFVKPRSLATWMAKSNEKIVNPQHPLYFMPSELQPFFRKTLRAYDVRPVEALADLNSPRDTVAVLDVSIWSALDTPQNRTAREAIRKGLLSETTSVVRNGSTDRTYRIYALHHFDPARAPKLLHRRFVPDCGPIPPEACSVATPGAQRQCEGWNDFELNLDLQICRWGRDTRSIIEFDRPVAAGDYVLHVVGFRRPFPDPVETMRFRFLGEKFSRKVKQAEGGFDIALPIHLKHDHTAPRLVVRHPVWYPREREGSGDRRRLSFLFSRAWLEPAGGSE